MRIWKQLLLCVVVLVGALCLWVVVMPTAGDTLIRMGAPAQVVAALRQISPVHAATPAAPAANAQNGAPRAPGAGGQGGGQGAGGRATLVVAKTVGTGTVNDRLSAIGSGEAIQTVVVMPQSSGTIHDIMVTSGQKVSKGQVLAKLDDDEQLIERDRAQVTLKSAMEKSASYKNLQSFSRLDVLDAQIAEQTAKLAVSTAELNLKRRDIVAPIDGIAGIVAVNVGDNVTTQTNVVTLDDRSAILVDFSAPERFVSALKLGHPVDASSIAKPGQVFKGEIEAIDNRVDAASRTIRIRAKVDNAADLLRGGMAFAVSIKFPGDTYPTVDPLAVQWDADGSFVWQVKDNKSVKTRVSIIQRNPDAVLVDAKLAKGDSVVTEGLQRVREGGGIRVAGAAAAGEVASQ